MTALVVPPGYPETVSSGRSGARPSMTSQQIPQQISSSSSLLSLDQLAAKRVDAMLCVMREEARLRYPQAMSSSSRNSSCTSLYSLDATAMGYSPTLSPTNVQPHVPCDMALMSRDSSSSSPPPSPLPTSLFMRAAAPEGSMSDLEDTCVSGLVALRSGGNM